jgi:hypothetical protein
MLSPDSGGSLSSEPVPFLNKDTGEGPVRRKLVASPARSEWHSKFLYV